MEKKKTRTIDERFMRRALLLAELHGRKVSPNPKVGAVLVKDGKVVGEGAHARFGGPHAEIVALRRAGSRARGATLYVTLEPCAHFGKTPPCSTALIEAGVARVVAAVRDPFHRGKGRGGRDLRRAGLRVAFGCLAEEARELNRDFFLSVLRGRPKVVLKAAVSLDGKIAAFTGRSKWISGAKSRIRVQRLRAASDAVLVGSGTALADDPRLDLRLPGHRRDDGRPFRVLLDSSLRVPPRANLFKGDQTTLVFASKSASKSRQKALERKGALVFRVPQVEKMLSLKAVLKVLHALEVRRLLVEGGGKVHGSFLRSGLADEAALFISTKLLGDDGPSWVRGWRTGDPNRAPRLRGTVTENLGEDLFLRGTFEHRPR